MPRNRSSWQNSATAMYAPRGATSSRQRSELDWHPKWALEDGLGALLDWIDEQGYGCRFHSAERALEAKG